MTITDQEPSAPATGESLLSSSAADIKHGAGNTKTTESASGTATSAGEILTGKQEHCNYYHFLSTPTLVSFLTHLADSLFLQRRFETRIDLTTSPRRDRRAQLPYRPQAFWRSLQVGIRRGRARRLRPTDPKIHLRPSCPQISILGPGPGEGVLAG